MVVAFYPENRKKIVVRKHGLLPFSDDDGAQCFVDGIERSCKESRLLTGNNRHAAGGADLFKQLQMLFSYPVLPVLAQQQVAERLPCERLRGE